MSDPADPLPIHSLAEARLYLRIKPCSACGDGPLIADPAGVQYHADEHLLSVPATCKACSQNNATGFDTAQIETCDLTNSNWEEIPAGQIINATDNPSRIIDIAGWLTLFTLLETEANSAGAPEKARQIHLCAGECIDEALKFFEPQNDLPPVNAFFSKNSRRQFRDRPERFIRQHLIDIRNKLPFGR